jgi:hypothetical protein
MKLTYRCWEPVQARAVLDSHVWANLKAMLIAGHKMVVEIRQETRSDEQNRRLWAMLTDISAQVDWYGQKLVPDEWKHVFSASLKKQKVVPGIDGGFVVMGQSTSKMTKSEMSDMQELMAAFGAERGVIFKDGYVPG